MKRFDIHIGVILAASVSVLFGLVLHSPAFAAVPADSGLSVTPAFSQIQLSQNQSTANLNQTLTNNTNDPLLVTPSFRDFTSFNDTGSVSFYGPGYNPTTSPHGLQEEVSFDAQNVLIAPHQSRNVTLTIQASQLAPGGHYGAALYSPVIYTGKESSNLVRVHSSVASLVFLVTSAGGIQNVALQPFQISSFSFSLPSTSQLVFSNNGNTQTAPRGQISIYNASNALIGTADLNSDSGLILPGTSRIFTTTIPIHNSFFSLPGTYSLKVQYRATNSAAFMTVTKQFFYMSPQFFLFILVLIAFIIKLIQKRERLIPKIRKLKLLFPKAKPKKPVSRKIHVTYEDEPAHKIR